MRNLLNCFCGKNNAAQEGEQGPLTDIISRQQDTSSVVSTPSGSTLVRYEQRIYNGPNDMEKQYYDTDLLARIINPVSDNPIHNNPDYERYKIKQVNGTSPKAATETSPEPAVLVETKSNKIVDQLTCPVANNMQPSHNYKELFKPETENSSKSAAQGVKYSEIITPRDKGDYMAKSGSNGSRSLSNSSSLSAGGYTSSIG
jgi:hypothetical protein